MGYVHDREASDDSTGFQGHHGGSGGGGCQSSGTRLFPCTRMEFPNIALNLRRELVRIASVQLNVKISSTPKPTTISFYRRPPNPSN
mmetsp:Transcript_59278/g.71315  ORF Transcript_59278/g.71315 Transcript_59278/m.71315 type:complete len:87 (-) Transcript_59278:658-918(-)